MRPARGGATVRVRVVPRARANCLGGVREGALVVRVTAPPVEGQANAAVCRYLGRLAGVPASSIQIVRGASGRDKLVRMGGLDEATLRTRLAALL